MCAVVGVYDNDRAAKLVYRGLEDLQHRGQESIGIAATHGDRIHVEKQMGLVGDFDPKRLEKLPGTVAIGHLRYSTAGESRIQGAQPLWTECYHGELAVCHNGNIVDQRHLKHEVMGLGGTFHTSSDTELVLHLYARSHRSNLAHRLVEVGSRLGAAFSLVMMTGFGELVAMRDPWGFRPLVIGQIGTTTVVASEDCTFKALSMTMGQEATGVRDILPGEMVIVDQDGISSITPFHADRTLQCVFEHVYFSRPDSQTFGLFVGEVRRQLGRSLARLKPTPADIIVGIPNSGMFAAKGYSEESGLPLEMGLVRNQYIGRTFIEPDHDNRSNLVEKKLIPVRDLLEGRSVFLVDDSLVRATTSKKIVNMVRLIGRAKEVHVGISCPPTISPCFYGVDTPRRAELIAASHTPDEICQMIGADSLTYNTLENLRTAVHPYEVSFCTSCYTDLHPLLEILGLNKDGQPKHKQALPA